MSPSSADKARLSIHQTADEEILKLDRAVKGAFYEFTHRFRENPDHPNLRLTPVKGDSGLFSAYINLTYRAVLVRTSGDTWLVVSVRDRASVSENLHAAINHVTGEIEFVDLSLVDDGALIKASQPATAYALHLEPDGPPNDLSPRRTKPAAPQHADAEELRPLLADKTVQQLRELGVAEPLLPIAVSVTTQEELFLLADHAPQLTKDVLLGLCDGKSTEEIEEYITRPVKAATPVDQADFAAALDRTPVTTSDADIRAVLAEGDFRHWKVFLHPTQARLVTKDYSGPTRVSGGPGTGKTIVALHRVRHLVETMPPGPSKPILLTTFNKNLAEDLRARLEALGGPELLARVDVTHVDQLAARIANEHLAGRRKTLIDSRRAMEEWRTMLAEIGETTWDPEFLEEEWTQVILGQAANTRTAYFQARRAGRGRSVTRADRSEIWTLVERYTQRLEQFGVETFQQIAERAARIEMRRADQVRHSRGQVAETSGPDLGDGEDSSSTHYSTFRYEHVVIDEAQDLSPAHWKLLRATVATGPNDMFITGDTHQRLYENQVALSSLGVNIRGRSARLTLSYRTTREILRTALAVLSGERFDDLDGGQDDLAGYRSVLRGVSPQLAGRDEWDWADELDAIARQVAAWRDVPGRQIAIAVPTNDLVGQVGDRLARDGIASTEVAKDGPTGAEGVHIGTMFRFKGLEYQRVIVASVTAQLMPRRSVQQLADSDPVRYRRELRRSRSLLFVAASRARDQLVFTWHGEPSPFLSRSANN